MKDYETHKSAWGKFYKAEESFMDTLVANSTCLFSEDGREPAYRQATSRTGDLLTSPPPHICWIGQTQMPKIEFDMHLNDLQSLYTAARGDKDTKRYPSRFPQFFESVEQINVVQNTAFSSTQLNPLADFFIVREEADSGTDSKAIAADLVSLIAAGFTATVSKETCIRNGNPEKLYRLKIPMIQLFEFANATSIQMRRLSGTAFRGTLRHLGDHRGHRINVGFVIVDASSTIKAVRSLPEGARPHRLAASGTPINLPVVSSYQLFKKA